MHRWIAILILFTSLNPLFAVDFQQQAVAFSEPQIEYAFGEFVRLRSQVDAEKSIQQLYLFLEPQGDSTLVLPVEINPNGEIDLTVDLDTHSLRPFSQVTGWFRAVLPSGDEVKSEPFSFRYDDNRFEWRTLENDRFVVQWMSGDVEFGQAVLNTAQLGLDNALTVLPAHPSYPMRIQVYDDPTRLQSALQLSGMSWVAGHASPDLNVVLVSIAPGPDQSLELERQIPHELMHILLFQAANGGYEQLPFWLNEGIAAQAELYPNPDYQRVLSEASDSSTLISIDSLCENRPTEASGAFLAYAESASFVRFLHQKFGSLGLLAIIETYKSGLGCHEAVQTALGQSLPDLESQWRQEVLGMDLTRLALQQLSPYLVISLIVLLPTAVLLVANRRKRPEKR